MADSPTLAELNASFFQQFLKPAAETPAGGQAVLAYKYLDLPLASAAGAGTTVRITDYPLQPNKMVVSDGQVWQPILGLPVVQHVNQRASSGQCNVLSSNSANNDSYNQSLGWKAKGAVSQLRMLFSNNAVGAGAGGTLVQPFEQAVTMEGSVTYNGVTTRAYWEGGGGASRTLQPGEEAWLVAEGLRIPDGGIAVINMHGKFAAVPANMPVRQGVMTSSGGYQTYDFNERGVNLADKTMGVMPTARGFPNTAILPPVAIVGVTQHAPTVVMIGDSNRAWSNDGMALAGMRAVDLGTGSYQLALFAANPANRIKNLRAMGITHAMITLAGGDVTDGKTAAEIYALMQQAAQIVADCGLIPICSTTPPKTNADNTATDARWAVIQAYNALIRSNNGVGYGYFDLFDVWGDRATGLWKYPNPTTPANDGTHASTVLHGYAATAFAAAIPALFK